MTATWPGSLPKAPLWGSYMESPRRPRVVFESDAGPPIERPRSSLRMTDISFALLLTDAQMGTLEDFVQSDIAGGTLPFLFEHPRTLNQATVRLIEEPPYQTELYAPGYWRATFRMLVIG